MIALRCFDEGGFQAAFCQVAVRRGYFVQKFQDSLALGIPDLYLASPDHAMWLELKWCDLPKRPSTPIGPRAHLSGMQLAWLSKAHRRPESVRAGLLLGTPAGWACIPAPGIPAFLSGPCQVVRTDTPTPEALWGALGA